MDLHSISLDCSNERMDEENQEIFIVVFSLEMKSMESMKRVDALACLLFFRF